MYQVKIEGHFSSAHNLRGYKGKCEELHGHNWKVELVVEKEQLNSLGMVEDFRVLKNRLNDVLDKMDHAYLNNLAYFKKVNPTSENIAAYLYRVLQPKISGLYSVTVWESENCSATYHEA